MIDDIGSMRDYMAALLLGVVLSLYGVLEAANYQFRGYGRHLVRELGARWRYANVKQHQATIIMDTEFIHKS